MESHEVILCSQDTWFQVMALIIPVTILYKTARAFDMLQSKKQHYKMRPIRSMLRSRFLSQRAWKANESFRKEGFFPFSSFVHSRVSHVLGKETTATQVRPIPTKSKVVQELKTTNTHQGCVFWNFEVTWLPWIQSSIISCHNLPEHLKSILPIFCLTL